VPEEANSNNESVLPWWNRLVWTFRTKSPENLRYCLDGRDAEHRQSIRGLPIKANVHAGTMTRR